MQKGRGTQKNIHKHHARVLAFYSHSRCLFTNYTSNPNAYSVKIVNSLIETCVQGGTSISDPKGFHATQSADLMQD